MGNKTLYTASEAIAAIEGMHRKRFYQMINNGDISYTSEQQGTKQVRLFDASELARVFGDKLRTGETEETHNETTNISFMKQSETPVNTIGNKLLEKDIEHLHERLADREVQLREKDNVIADIKQERDDWKQQAQKLLLTHTPQSDAKTEKPSQNRKISAQGIIVGMIAGAALIALLVLLQMKA